MDDITSRSLAELQEALPAGGAGEQPCRCSECGSYLIVDVDSPDLPSAATGRVQARVTMVTGGRKGFLVVELQHTLGEESLS